MSARHRSHQIAVGGGVMRSPEVSEVFARNFSRCAKFRCGGAEQHELFFRSDQRRSGRLSKAHLGTNRSLKEANGS